MLAAEIKLHAHRLYSGENRCARVALFDLAAVPVLGVPWCDLGGQLLLVQLLNVDLGLVKAKYCGLILCQKVLKDAFVECGIDSIYIPAPYVDFTLREVI